MIDIGWSEMAVVALIALLILGPKELPQAMRMVARWVRKLRGMTREFQSGFDQMVREAELDDARKAVQATTPGSFKETVADTIDPTGTLSESMEDLRKDARELDKEAREDLKEGRAEGGTADSAEADSDEMQSPKIIETPLKVAPDNSLGSPQKDNETPSTERNAANSSAEKEKHS